MQLVSSEPHHYYWHPGSKTPLCPTNLISVRRPRETVAQFYCRLGGNGLRSQWLPAFSIQSAFHFADPMSNGNFGGVYDLNTRQIIICRIGNVGESAFR